ncbi:extracellular serine/threonine protein kinase FAM20C isoform X2 [Gallus gallus]|uniref:extracellular serine/threonine protein kinase FAM20C isoform X2 n=1 Tax=Gallus gallus TaxID=9031 RepID=UPI001AE33913|nr:extracellular serine/threonine protein kinase FAM20C isoform X2 [Gallus gallus]
MRLQLQTLVQRKFKVLLLLLLLLALLLHVTMDLALPATRRPCSSDAKEPKASGTSTGSPLLASPEKLSLRILQDFSGSNGSLEKSSQPQGAGPKGKDGDVGIQHRHGDVGPAWAKGSKLAALFEHPLYNIPLPEVKDKDKLFIANPMEKFSLRSSRSDEWVSSSKAEMVLPTGKTAYDTYPAWLKFHIGINRYELYPRRDPLMPTLLQDLATMKIVSSVQKSGGTQLKLIMTFSNYGQALFKPMKQSRNQETPADFFYFSDFERHNAEIAAFHLDRILDFRRIPPVSGRLVNITKEIRDITTDKKLARTFFISPGGSWIPTTAARCAGRRPMTVVIASLTSLTWQCLISSWATWTDTTMRPLRNLGTTPFCFTWTMAAASARTPATRCPSWPLSSSAAGKRPPPPTRGKPTLMPSSLLLFGSIKKSTYLRLRLLATEPYRLSELLREALAADHLAPILAEPHLQALDRRLGKVLAAVGRCLATAAQPHQVLVDDIGPWL